MESHLLMSMSRWNPIYSCLLNLIMTCLATDSSHCIPCPAFSGQDEENVRPSQLCMSDIADCMCFSSHERTQDSCRNCSQYMIQPFFSNNVCSNCPAGHFFVDRHVPCHLCDVAQDGGERHVGLVLNLRDASLQWADDESDFVCRPGFESMMHGLCKECSVGKFRGGNNTQHCELCPYDTFQDSVGYMQLACIQCPEHSSTLFHIGRKSVSECVCGAGFQPMSQAGLCAPCAAGTFRSTRLANESTHLAPGKQAGDAWSSRGEPQLVASLWVRCVCFITAGPITKLFAWGGRSVCVSLFYVIDTISGGHVL
jgi:hypothetical protein